MSAIINPLKEQKINLPLVGSASLAGIILVGGLIWFLTRRKKSISLKL